MTDRPQVARGDPIMSVFTRRYLESTHDAANRSRQRITPPPGETPPWYNDRTTYINLINKSGGPINRYEPLFISGPTQGYAGSNYWSINNLTFNGTAITGVPSMHNFAVALNAVPDGYGTLAAIEGMIATPVYFESDNGKWIRRCDVLAGQTILAALPNGAAEIIWADPTALGQPAPVVVDCLVRLRGPQDVTYPGAVVNGDIPAGGAGIVSLYQNDADTNYQISPVYLDHMEQGLQVSDTKEVKVTWYHGEKRWRLDGAECEDTETYMAFKGNYDPANTPYSPGSVVNTQSFTMHAKTSTSQDPTPFPNNNPQWTIPDSPSWSPGSDTGVVITGNEYTFNRYVVVEGWRVWIPTISANHQYTVFARDITTTGKPLLLFNQSLSPSATGWVAIGIPPVVVYDGEVIEIGLIAENTAGTSDHLNAPWVYAGRSQNAEPFGGGFNRNNQNTTLRIDIDDDNGTDRNSELSGIVPGDVIQIYNGSVRADYSVISNNGLGLTAYSYTVALINAVGDFSVGAPYTIQVERSGSTTDYVSDLNLWQSNTPSWAEQVRGFVQTGGTPTYDQNAYGADILEDGWNVPSDWEVVSISSREL